MSDFYCHVVDGEIQAYNLPKPKAWGNTAFGAHATDDDYRAVGLWPIAGEAPAYDSATQRLEGPLYVPNAMTQTVEKQYAVVNVQHAELTAPVWEAIKHERDRRKSGGVKVVINGVDKWFHSDDPSRIQQLGLLMMGANIPANLQWKTMDGSFVTMTQELANQVFQAEAAADQANFANAEVHRVAMEAAANPAAYDFSAGWVQTYDEFVATL